jgi:hypothetical protein
MVFLPFLVTVRRIWASWVAPANSTQAGAVVTLMVRVVLRPCPRLVVVWLGTSFQGRLLQALWSVGWLPLTVKRSHRRRWCHLLRGVGLCVHCVDGDDDVGEVEHFQELLYCWDLVGFRGHRELPDHCSGGLVEGGDQVRCCRGLGSCATYGLAVQGDHATCCDGAGAGPYERADELVDEVGVEAGEHSSDGRLVRDR